MNENCIICGDALLYGIDSIEIDCKNYRSVEIVAHVGVRDFVLCIIHKSPNYMIPATTKRAMQIDARYPLYWAILFLSCLEEGIRDIRKTGFIEISKEIEIFESMYGENLRKFGICEQEGGY